MRKLILSGRIVADAEKKVTVNGREFISFRLGNNEFGDDKNADGEPITYWFNVSSFNQAHINLLKYLTKGKPINVIGSYKDNIYQNKSGNCEIGRNILADSIDFQIGNESNNSNHVSNNTTSVANNTTSVSNNTTSVSKTEIPQVTASEVKTKVDMTNKHKPTIEAVNDSEDDELPF